MVAGFVLFMCYIMCLLIALRIFSQISPTIIVCLLAWLVYFFGLFVASALVHPIYFFIFSATYWCFSLIFLMIFGAVFKSISLRMMQHLFHQSGKMDSYHSLLARYIKKQSYTERLKILLEKKMIEEKKSSYYLTNKGRSIAAKIYSLQKIFSIQESG